METLASIFDLFTPQNVTWLIGTSVLLAAPVMLLGIRYIPNNRVGIIEKFWSPTGSLNDGRLIALRGEAGYQAEVLRGGLHFFYWRWQYRIHRVPLTVVPQGKIGYTVAPDGNTVATTISDEGDPQ